MIVCYDEYKLNSSQTELKGYCWEPQHTKAVIILVHGMGEHAKRFEDSVIKYLLESNYAVLALDLYGHGLSKGKRGHCPSYKALIDAVDALVSKSRELFLSQPIYLYGHSMGANIVINYALLYPDTIKKVIASSPFLRLAFVPPKWKMFFGKLLFKVMPSLTLASELDVNAISRVPLEVKRYVDDTLIHNRISPMYLFPVIEAGEQALAKASELKVPSLITHGKADRLTDHKASVEFSNQSELATLKLFENGYHELHHDLCKDEFIKTVLNWLDQQSGK